MGKKKTRSKYTSNGGPPSVSRTTLNSIRKDRTDGYKLLNKVRAWSKGKRTMVTVENPDKSQTNKRYIRVEGNNAAAFGPWKKQLEG